LISGLLDKAVGVFALRAEAGVEPDLVARGLALLVVRIVLVKEVQLRHPHLDCAVQILRVAGLDHAKLRCVLAQQRKHRPVSADVHVDGLVGQVLHIAIEPALLLQVLDQGREELRIERIRFGRGGIDGWALNLAILHLANPHDKLRLPALGTAADVAAFDPADDSLFDEDLHPAIKTRKIDIEPAVGGRFEFRQR